MLLQELGKVKEEKRKVTMFASANDFRSSGRVVPPLAAGRSPTDDI